MRHVPFPLRVAAGLAVSTAERARELPRQVVELPVTVASQVLQASMRVQQHVTELAIKGDDALSTLRRADESPEWATFDEDLGDDADAPAASGNAEVDSAADDPWAEEERALAAEHTEGEFDVLDAPGGLARYDELTLPQVRARLRSLSQPQLEELLAYEQAHANRPSFVGMLTRRIANVRQAGEPDDTGSAAAGE
ncbi:lipid droplet-associated protein [Saccharomonospora piscinae]|uniref:lipid droplet-associated protein n=1 Tax=Saccharomonospora piscinae TaxID=687388 RepID=UPI00046478C3|nr:lipid droplet-associated protein [Saccharomonospora piscinae]